MTITEPAPALAATPVTTPAVAARDVTRRYGSGDAAVDALRGITMSVPTGQFVAVMGPSGSGKSTLLHVLAGLDRPTDGSVTVAGHEITTMGDKALTRLRRDHIGFVFQAYNLLPQLSAEENVLLPLDLAGRKADREFVDAVFARVGLSDRRKHKPSELSGGQQQRVAVARALVAEPDVLFADEPTGNLDSHASADILRLMRGSVDAYGQTTVMVTHDPHAASIADRVIVLADGECVADIAGPSEDDIVAALHEAVQS
jgi:putative ABC transport system ATP-binding protein